MYTIQQYLSNCPAHANKIGATKLLYIFRLEQSSLICFNEFWECSFNATYTLVHAKSYICTLLSLKMDRWRWAQPLNKEFKGTLSILNNKIVFTFQSLCFFLCNQNLSIFCTLLNTKNCHGDDRKSEMDKLRRVQM